MAEEWAYHKFSNDVWMFGLKLNNPVASFGAVPIAVAMQRELAAVNTSQSVKVVSYQEVTDEDGKVTKARSERDIGAPSGPMHEPSAWRGVFDVEGNRFKIPSVFGYPKLGNGAFLGLSCNSETGTHSETVMRGLIERVNTAQIVDEIVEPPPPAPNLVFVSEDVGGGRFGFSLITHEGFGIERAAGSLEGAELGGICAMYEERPGDGTRDLWLITNPYVNVGAVSIEDDTDWVRRVATNADYWVYHVGAGEVQWPNREAREAGVKVRIEYEDGRILHADGGWRMP